MSNPPLWVLDLETTGLSPSSACVWSIAVVCVQDGVIVDTFASKVRPVLEFFQASHRDVVRRISGLTDVELLELLDAPKIGVVSESLWDWTDRYTPKEDSLRVTSYNTAFDRPFWQEHFDGNSLWQPCLMEAARQSLELAKWPKLAEACAAFEIPLEGAHRAEADALAAANLAIRLGVC